MSSAEASLLATIANALPAVIAYIDRDERYRYANGFYIERYGRRADIVGKRAEEVLGPAQYERVRPYIRRALAGETVSFEVEVPRTARRSLYVGATYVPDVAADGSVRGFSAFSEDITARHEAEQALSRSIGELRVANEMLDAVVRASPAAIMLLDADGVVRMWNPAAERIYGWSAEEVLGQLLPAIGPDQVPQFRAHLARVVAGEVVDGVASRRLRRNGEFDAMIWGAPVRRTDGTVQCLSVVADMTGRQRLEDSHRFLAEAGRVFASSLDVSETVERAARMPLPQYGDWCFVQLFDDGAELLRRAAVACADPSKVALAEALKRHASVRLRNDIEELRAVRNASPVLRPITDELLRLVATSDEHHADLRAIGGRSFIAAPLLVRGRVTGSIAVISCARDFDAHDLSTVEEFARQAAAAIDNARLFAAEHRARNRMTRLQDVTAAFSRARTAKEVAEVACRIGATAMEAYAGVLWLLDETRDGALAIAGTWGTPTSFIEQFRVLRRDDDRFPATTVVRSGEPIWIETEEQYARMTPSVFELAKRAGRVSSSANVPLSIAGRVAGVITFAHPIGHRYDDDDRGFYVALARNCEQALERARLLDEARRANRAKDEFLAMLGHELRNPLAPIMTAVELMKSRAGSEVVERERVVIDRQVRHLGRLVDDLLDVSRITAGRIQLQLERIEVDAVVARAVEMTMPLIAERKHGLAVDVEAGLVVEGDPTRLAQVLANLLTNSARYTPPCGHIRLEASRDRESLRLRVSDDGVGIAPELLPHVFDVFTQGAQPLDRPHGGLGLGLAIVRSLVTLHRGTVTAHSDGRDRGARFEIRLPLAAGETIGEVAPANAGASENPRATARRARVLIVDDNRDGADLLADALELQGFATTIAHDGATALELAPRFAPDVALLDIGLPEMDGFEVARRLRTQAAPLKLIAITGYGQAEDRERSRSAGFDDFVVKPVDLARLRSILDRLLA